MPIDKAKIEELNTLLQNPDRSAVQAQIDQTIKDLGLDTDINKPLDKKTTLAHFAAKHNMPDVINYLITKSADFSLKDSARPGHTPAYYAARENNKDAIRSLVRARADFSDPTIQKQLNKHSALDFLHECEDAQAIEDPAKTDFFKTVPEAGVDGFLSTLHNINAKDDNGWTVARHMAEYGREDILNHLIEKGMDLEIAGKDGKTVFDILNTRNPELAEKIRKNFEKKRAEDALTQVDWTTVSLDEIKKLVDKGADLRKVTTTAPLAHLALTNNHPEILDYLVNQNIDLNAKDASGKTIAHIAAEKGYKGVLLNLVEKSFQKDGVDWSIVDGSGKSPMDAMADPTLKKEIEDSLNATKDLLTTTDWANISSEQVNDLIQKGARINAQDKNGKNAIMMAVQANNLDALKTLVDNNALLDKKDNSGKTVAHIAAEAAVNNTADTKILDYLAEKKVDFNVQNNRGRTPAHLAMGEAAFKMHRGTMAPEEMQVVAESLINAGADFELKDKSGKTVMDYIPEGDEKENIKEAFKRKKEENESSEIDPNLLNNPLKQGEDEEESGAPQQEEEKSDNSKVAEDIAHALKDATKAFVKNVFEADFKTAEDFATAFLFNMLAFPLEAIHGYLDPSGDPQLSELKAIKELLKQQMAANAQNGENGGNAPLRLPPLTEQQKNLISLKDLMMTADPEAFEQLNNAVGKLSPEDLGRLTVEQMQERAQKMQQFLQANPALQQRFKDALTNVIKLPQGKEIFEKCFQGHSGEITPDKVIAVLTGGRVDKDNTKMPSSPAPDPAPKPTGPDLPDSTPKIQAAILKSYQDIMDSNSLNKDQKKVKLESFLIDLSEKNPEFKTLSSAISLLHHNEKLLEGLKTGTKGKTGEISKKDGALTQKGVDKLLKNGKDAFKNLTMDEVREAGNLALTLKQTLSKGSKAGATDPRAKTVLTGMMAERISKIGR